MILNISSSCCVEWDLVMMEFGSTFCVYKWNKTGGRDVENLAHYLTGKRSVWLQPSFLQTLPSLLSVYGKKSSPILQPHSLITSKSTSAFKVSALSWVPRALHLKPSRQGSQFSEHHPLLRLQVHYWPDPSGQRDRESRFASSSCYRDTDWRSFI